MQTLILCLRYLRCCWLLPLLLCGLSFPAAAQVAFVATSNVTASGAVSSVQIPGPSGLVAGHVMLALVAQRGNATPTVKVSSVPTGWTLVRNTTDGSAIGMSIYWKLATASEPGTYQFELNASDRASGAIVAFSGVDTVSPIDASASQANAASTTYTAPSVTTSTANTMLVAFYSASDTNNVAAPSGMTSAFSVSSGAGPNGLSVSVAYATQPSAGASGTRLSTGNSSQISLGALVALKPPAVVATCLADTFSTGTLDTTLWNVSGINYTPQVVTSPTVTSNRLRLTNTAGSVATFAQFKRWFPAANNKVVVEFDYFGWGGSGADGIAMVLSDASVNPTPGGYGGSLGYANRSGIDGFGGGWLGVGLDEFGNYPGTGEGRRGYPTNYTPPIGANVSAAAARNSIAVRGSGTGQSAGYVLLANSGTLATAVQTGTTATDSTTKHRYRITVDHSNSVNAYVSVERDTTGTGSSYSTVIPAFDAKGSNSGQAAVPANLMLSFTGSTGGSTNNHEIANVRVCATTMNPVGNNSAAANFECMDDYLAQASYNNRQASPASRNPVYTKLARTAFKLRVVPLASDGSVKTDYVTAGGSSRAVTVELFDDNTAPAPVCSAYSASNLVATQSVTLASGVGFLTGNFTVNKAYPKLRCRVTDSSAASLVYGCGSDQFSVRPGLVALSTTASAAAPSASASPVVKAGAGFTLNAATSTASTDAYSGTLSQNAASLSAQVTTQAATQASGGTVGTLTPASLTANAPSTGNAAYDEAGYLYLAAGAYRDTTYTAVDQVGDCVAGSTSVALSNGQYGCVIGTTAAISLGRFIPDRFAVTSGSVVAACRVHPAASPGYTPTDFTYFSQPEGFGTPFTLRALNVAGTPTQNYAGAFARISSWNSATSTTTWAWSSTSSATGPRFGTSASLPAGSALSAATVSGVAVAPSGTWAGGVVALSAVQHQVSRPTALTGETAVTVTALPIDPDGVTLSAAAAVSSSATLLRWGRVRMLNAYGSEQLALAVPVHAQVYDAGTGTFKANPDDSCTPLAVPVARTLSGAAVPDGMANEYFYPVPAPVTLRSNQLASTDTTATLASTLVGGVASLNFTKPAKSGWLDIILSVPDYLKANWNNCMGQSGAAGLHDDQPCARATFGVFRSPLIYRRENY
jgi:MSHA biogenesis protein MshQ